MQVNVQPASQLSLRRHHSRFNARVGPGSRVNKKPRRAAGSALKAPAKGAITLADQFQDLSAAAPRCTMSLVGPRGASWGPELSRVAHRHRGGIKGSHHGSRLGNVKRSPGRRAAHPPLKLLNKCDIFAAVVHPVRM